jgi:putative transposase
VSAFKFIAAEKANHPIDLMCRVLEISRSGFYAWATRAPSDRALSDAWLTEQIREIHAANRGVYGAPRVQAELRMARGISVGRKRVERLMRSAGISGLVAKQHGRTTIRVPGVRVADDLVNREFRPTTPTSCGWPTSRTSEAGRAGCTSLPSRTPTAAGSSAGASPITCAPISSSTR